MAVTTCPHCGFDRAASTLASSVGKGAVFGVVAVLNPILGAIVATGMFLKALIESDDTEVKCPDCGKMYSD